MIWGHYRPHGPSEEARTALRRSEISLALASDLEERSLKVTKDIQATLERNHLAEAIEATILGVHP